MWVLFENNTEFTSTFFAKQIENFENRAELTRNALKVPGWCDLNQLNLYCCVGRSVQAIYQAHQKTSQPALAYRVKCNKILCLLTKYSAKNWHNIWWRLARKYSGFYILFLPSDLDLWHLDLKFASLVTLVSCQSVIPYVSTKLEVSMAFLFREYRRHGTDGQTAVVQRLWAP